MKSRNIQVFTTLIHLLWVLNTVIGQNSQSEIILAPFEYPDNYKAASIGNKTIFAPSAFAPQSSDPYVAPIYLLNNDKFKLLDSIIIDHYLGYKHPFIMDMITLGDSLFVVSLTDFSNFRFTPSRNNVLFIDTNLKVVKNLSIIDSTGAYNIYTMDKIGDSLFLYFENMTPNGAFYPRIHILNLKNLRNINQITYKDTNMVFDYFEHLHPIKNGYVAFGTTSIVQKIGYLLNDTLGFQKMLWWNDTLFKNDISGRFAFDSDQVIFSSRNHFYSTGYFNQMMSLVKFSKTMKLLRIDTFGIPQRKNTIKSLPRFVHGASSYRTLDSVFIAGSRNTVNIFSFSSWQNFLKEPFQNAYVYNIDTAGNINWRKEIHQDSTIFITTAIEATPDGGALVFSSKFDLKYKLSPHLRTSVIKLDRLGNVVNEREFTPPQPRWSVYPNPMRSRFTLTGLEENETVQMQLLNLNGQVMWEQTGRAGAYTLPPQLEKGFYLLQLSNEQGQDLGVRRVMVEGR